MVDDRSADDSNDGDYDDRSDATGSQRGCRPRKRVRRTKTEDVVATVPTYPLDVLCQATTATSSSNIARSVSSSSDKRDSKLSPLQERAMSIPVRNSRFSSVDDALLLQLKGEGLSCDKISDRFPGRSKGTLQVHYGTKLNLRTTRKRGRNGWLI
ncbi:hypothetical protein BJ875DRAFT_526584 [Amylocarpus encephaloides]|uniref:Myb-like domain-containing protein n=1 Tax=Amylocarpus encephaloides TaxID=45428 RepID=A0A9P7Y7X2_9HELO|nr:hypothetical protein BJ875DRAFT_526584 [Amylocarpus encephaloides]